MAYIPAVATTGTTKHTIEEIIQLVWPHFTERSEKLDFIVLCKVEPFQRKYEISDLGVIVPKIQKQHQLSRTSDGQLVKRKISCKSCLQLKVTWVLSMVLHC